MGTSGRPIDESTKRQIVRLREIGLSIRETAKALRLDPSTVLRNSKRDIDRANGN